MSGLALGQRSVEERAAELRAARLPFVRATVVRVEPPTSARPGDVGLVLGDGELDGFVGGQCAEASVRLAALERLAVGEPTLLRISPDAEPERPGVANAHNPCLSGGAIELFLEPVLPPPLLCVLGEGPIARALSALGERAGFGLAAVALDGPVPADAAALVVASHGRGEEAALRAALESGVPYIGLVASARRGAAVLDAMNLCCSARSRIRTPAGLDLGARTPQETAVSILAQIIAERPRPALGADRRGPADAPAPEPPEAAPTVAVDPVCAMSVAPGPHSLHARHGADTVWFCGPGCRDAFLAEPDRYRR
ncbi:MAG: XdhC family protein [Acidimicrobiales bacterium]